MIANLISNKTLTAFGLVFPAGVLTYSLTFTISNMINELLGRKVMFFIIKLSACLIIVQYLFVAVAVHSPGSPFWVNQAAYSAILLNKFRIFIASITAFFISQSINIWLFDFLKQKHKSGHLWFRKNISTVFSQIIDSFIFILVAFSYTTLPVFDLLAGQLVCKVTISLLDTPVIYIAVSSLKEKLPKLEHR
jgi:hypothetical protein